MNSSCRLTFSSYICLSLLFLLALCCAVSGQSFTSCKPNSKDYEGEGCKACWSYFGKSLYNCQSDCMFSNSTPAGVVFNGTKEIIQGNCVKRSGSAVSCGNHTMNNCSVCSLDKGEFWCGGDCFWNSTSSSCDGSLGAQSVDCGVVAGLGPHRAFSCDACAHGRGSTYCGGDCVWSSSSSKCVLNVTKEQFAQRACQSALHDLHFQGWSSKAQLTFCNYTGSGALPSPNMVFAAPITAFGPKNVFANYSLFACGSKPLVQFNLTYGSHHLSKTFPPGSIVFDTTFIQWHIDPYDQNEYGRFRVSVSGSNSTNMIAFHVETDWCNFNPTLGCLNQWFTAFYYRVPRWQFCPHDGF